MASLSKAQPCRLCLRFFYSETLMISINSVRPYLAVDSSLRGSTLGGTHSTAGPDNPSSFFLLTPLPCCSCCCTVTTILLLLLLLPLLLLLLQGSWLHDLVQLGDHHKARHVCSHHQTRTSAVQTPGGLMWGLGIHTGWLLWGLGGGL